MSHSAYNPHPGEHIADELHELNMSQADLARALGIPRARVSEIIRGERRITADTALRLAHWLGTSAEMWLRLQDLYDLRQTDAAHGQAIKRAVTPLYASDDEVPPIADATKYDLTDINASAG